MVSRISSAVLVHVQREMSVSEPRKHAGPVAQTGLPTSPPVPLRSAGGRARYCRYSAGFLPGHRRRWLPGFGLGPHRADDRGEQLEEGEDGLRYRPWLSRCVATPHQLMDRQPPQEPAWKRRSNGPTGYPPMRGHGSARLRHRWAHRVHRCRLGTDAAAGTHWLLELRLARPDTRAC